MGPRVDRFDRSGSQIKSVNFNSASELPFEFRSVGANKFWHSTYLVIKKYILAQDSIEHNVLDYKSIPADWKREMFCIRRITRTEMACRRIYAGTQGGQARARIYAFTVTPRNSSSDQFNAFRTRIPAPGPRQTLAPRTTPRRILPNTQHTTQ